jgi:hypothetical protein
MARTPARCAPGACNSERPDGMKLIGVGCLCVLVAAVLVGVVGHWF